MAIILASLLFLLTAAGCAERLVRGPRALGAVAWVPPMLGAWLLLWWLRLPPTPGSAMLTFGLADVAVLVVGVVGVLRLLGGFEQRTDPPPPDSGEDDGDREPDGGPPSSPRPELHPRPRAPRSPHPTRRGARPRVPRSRHGVGPGSVDSTPRDSARDDVAPGNR